MCTSTCAMCTRTCAAACLKLISSLGSSLDPRCWLFCLCQHRPLRSAGTGPGTTAGQKARPQPPSKGVPLSATGAQQTRVQPGVSSSTCLPSWLRVGLPCPSTTCVWWWQLPPKPCLCTSQPTLTMSRRRMAPTTSWPPPTRGCRGQHPCH